MSVDVSEPTDEAIQQLEVMQAGPGMVLVCVSHASAASGLLLSSETARSLAGMLWDVANEADAALGRAPGRAGGRRGGGVDPEHIRRMQKEV